jgi:serine/threonine-protein kinase
MAVATAKRILSPGTRIAGYCIEAEIGHGAMAVVYRAKQLNLDRPVALKILSDELAANHEFVSRFFNEARAAAALSHPHIVQAYDAGIADGGIHFFAMEYVEGETLLQRIRHQGHIRPGPGIALAIDIADALNYGWLRQGLTHGDIKPENIMINQAGESKLADFGLAKVAGHDFTGTEILLTPLYAAPETIRGEQGRGTAGLTSTPSGPRYTTCSAAVRRSRERRHRR